MMLRRSSLWLLLCALTMRALVPTGFMIDGAIGHGPALVACDGKGAIFAAVPTMSHYGHHEGQRSAPGNGDCPLSSMGAIDVPLLVIVERVGENPRVRPQFVADRRPYRPAAVALPPPSTGPPFIA